MTTPAAPCPACAARATPDEIAQARDIYADDNIEVDDDARVSRPDPGADADNGVWVAAWVWVPAADDDT